jgi:NAD(P)H-hydrate repair Nnr-like enzyme with NAD(P)H-hydrate dehydratase domain
MIVPFSEVSVGCSLVLNKEAGVKVSSRTADIIVGEVDGKSIWKKVWVKQKQDVVIADPGQGIVLTW